MPITKPTLDELTRESRIAYFSMEIALQSDIPTYAGGLGVLAGDTLRTAADLELPLVAVTLVSRGGYLRQTIDDAGRQGEAPDPWEPARSAEELPAKVSVTIAGHDVWIGAWLYLVRAERGGVIPVVLLDTDQPENASDDRGITRSLYGGDEVYRLKQEIVLGVGGVRMLQALGFTIRKFHMNEGHSALLAVELIRRAAYAPEDVKPGEPRWDLPRVRNLCIFTTHTPVDAGHDVFRYELVENALGSELDIDELKRLGGDDKLNMTRLALNASEYVNGVAEKHAEVSRRMFPGYRFAAITNGVHPHTWTHSALARLLDNAIPGWCHDPAKLVRVDQIRDELLLEAHGVAKAQLLDVVAQRSGVRLSPSAMTLGFARRMTAYKRPDLLFSDIDRLTRIARDQPLQILMAGKAHPRDHAGKDLIARLHEIARALRDVVPVVFLPNYDMDLARALVSGVDVWLNTPQRPYEASGTSGMKAALNGVPSLSVLDGWWIEGCIEGLTGWAVGGVAESGNGSDAGSLYEKLERAVVPAWKAGGAAWTALMKGAIGKNGAYFNSHRMMLRYAVEPYLR